MKRHTKVSWTQAMIDLFDSMWNDGSDYQAIRYAINRKFSTQLSHSALCGHAFRNGYKRGRTNPKPPKPKAPKSPRASRKLINAKNRALIAEQRASIGLDDDEQQQGRSLLEQRCWLGTLANTVSFLEMAEGETCKWPMEVDGEVRWCRNKKTVTCYCAAHAAIAYRGLTYPKSQASSTIHSWNSSRSTLIT